MSKELKIKNFRVTGSFRSRGETVNFSKDVRGLKPEADITEKIMIHFGSKHNIKRQLIKINSIKEISKKDEIKDRTVQDLQNTKDFNIIRGS